MSRTYVPPIKCQGIKTKIVPLILANVSLNNERTWYEPFMGSGVVGFNLRPRKAIFGDINPHVIKFYNALKTSAITPGIVREYLEKEGANLRERGENHYYYIRERFNEQHDPLDFLFLSRSCFNGMIRFNKAGCFNVPFCRKPKRFSRAYITKVVHQVKYVWEAVRQYDWSFECLPFHELIPRAGPGDMIYCDPPYLGRHVDYYDSWTAPDEKLLYWYLSRTPARFILSTWHSNRYRKNPSLETTWREFHIITKQHFYHVGAKETNRNSVLEALVMNFDPRCSAITKKEHTQLRLLEFG